MDACRRIPAAFSSYASRSTRSIRRSSTNAETAMAAVMPTSKVNRRGCAPGATRSTATRCHGRAWFLNTDPAESTNGRSKLADWQIDQVKRAPELLLRGLIQSDGCRFINTSERPARSSRGTASRIAPRTSGSIVCWGCDLLGPALHPRSPHAVVRLPQGRRRAPRRVHRPQGLIHCRHAAPRDRRGPGRRRPRPDRPATGERDGPGAARGRRGRARRARATTRRTRSSSPAARASSPPAWTSSSPPPSTSRASATWSPASIAPSRAGTRSRARWSAP